MKKFALAAVLTVASTAAFAGNPEPVVPMIPVMPPEAVQPPSSSGAGLIVPLILVALIAAALAD